MVALLLVALPAIACEKCGMYYDSQALRWCKYCVLETYCGYFQCVIETDDDDYQYCGGSWSEVEGSDQCFTDGGVRKNLCGPEEKDPIGEAARPAEWRLVRARVLPVSAAQVARARP